MADDAGDLGLTEVAVMMIAAGAGSAALNVAIDGSTGRWWRLSSTEIVVVFD